jgi:hypothetical protein
VSSKKARTPGTGEGEEQLPELDFDLRLETPKTGDRRTSFFDKGKDALTYAQTKSVNHIGFLLVVFAFFSVVLSPFLYRGPKIVKVHVNDGGIGVAGDCMCNSTTFLFLDGEVSRLKAELASAMMASQEETRKANDIILLQYDAIKGVEETITALAAKHQEAMRVVNVDTDKDDAMHGGHYNIFVSMRDDMTTMKSQVQSLTDTHIMIQQFNGHAESLIVRSKEMEALIRAQNETCAVSDPLSSPSPSSSSSSSSDVGEGERKCDCDCDCDATIASAAAATASTSATLHSEPQDVSNLVNLDMARKIISDEVDRECKRKINEVQEVYDTKMKRLGDDCGKQCMKANAAVEAESAMKAYNERLNFAARKSGATVVHSHTSNTWQPAIVGSDDAESAAGSGSDNHDLASKTAAFVKGQEHLWDKTVLLATGKKMEEVLNLESIEATVRGVTDVLSAQRQQVSSVGSPEDAISEDMSLGSCWPIANGGRGHITIKLPRAIYISGLSIDHITRNEAVDIFSAPKDFRLFAISGDSDGSVVQGSEKLVTEGIYSIEDGALSSQSFHAHTMEPVSLVKLEIVSNHGHPDYTCLYRVRIYGA